MRDDQILEDNVVVSIELNLDHGAIVADDVDFFLNVTFLNDYTWLSYWFLARVNTFDEVYRCEWLNSLECVL